MEEADLGSNEPEERFLALVRSMQPGDRIAIKSSYTRKHEVPFDNRGRTVSVMAIRAIGTVTDNPGDGRTVKVAWKQPEPPSEWYYLHQPHNNLARGAWRLDERCPDSVCLRRQTARSAPVSERALLARTLRRCRDPKSADSNGRGSMRPSLTSFLASDRIEPLWWPGSIRSQRMSMDSQICKISFPMGHPAPSRISAHLPPWALSIAALLMPTARPSPRGWRAYLVSAEAVPQSFEGIPILNNQKSWFFGYETGRQPDDIDALWGVFAAALRFAGSEGLQKPVGLHENL